MRISLKKLIKIDFRHCTHVVAFKKRSRFKRPRFKRPRFNAQVLLAVANRTCEANEDDSIFNYFNSFKNSLVKAKPFLSTSLLFAYPTRT